MLQNIVVLVLLTGSLSSLKGQLFKKDYLYADLALGIGNFNAGAVAVTYVNDKGYSFGASLQYALRSTVNKLSYYQSNSIKVIGKIPFIPEGPHNQLINFEDIIDRTWPMSDKPYKARLHLQAGLGLAEYTTTANWRSESRRGSIGCLFCGDYYEYSEPRITTLVFTIYPEIEIPFGRIYSMILGPEFLVTGQTVSVELIWSQMICIVRPEKY